MGSASSDQKISHEWLQKKSYFGCSIDDMDALFNKKLVEEYNIMPPFSSVRILSDSKEMAYYYMAIEPELIKETRDFVMRARKNFIASINSYPSNKEERSKYMQTFLKTFNESSGGLIQESEMEKVLYYFKREFEGYGPVEVPLLDDNIEDISCVGPRSPIYVVHRKYGSIVTNICFESERELDRFVRLIVQRSGKHISISVPMVDCSLPNGARLQATLGREVTKNGSTFTIRRFKQDPLTPLDLIKLGTMSIDIAVYLWQAVENGGNMFIIGGTASGKTTTLNSILLFVPLNKKIVSIEDTKELNIPHENWVQSLTRQGAGDVNQLTRKRMGELDMFDLLVNSLRQRPDYIVVGEVRGREAYTVFQSMATGQSAISTFHSSDMPSFVHRLEGEPLNIPRSMISSLDIVVIQSQTKVGNSIVRRIDKVVEIGGIDKESNEVVTNNVFEWDQENNKFIYSGHSIFENRILNSKNLTLEHLSSDTEKRKKYLRSMLGNERINSFNFSKAIHAYKIENAYGNASGNNSGGQV